MRIPLVACCIAIIVSALSMGGNVRAQPIDDLVIFGDSLSDVGNVGSTFLGQFFIPSENDGDRFSNGPVWAELLAGGLGLSADVFSRGPGPNDDNYAHGGATSENGTSAIGVTRNLGRQLDNYRAADAPAAGDLHILWIGGNDYINGQDNTDFPTANIRSAINTLITEGASQFLIPNLPPLGKTPRYRGSTGEQPLDALAQAHNAKLANRLAEFDDDPALAFYRLDVFDLFQEVLADPANFGLVNVTDQGIDTVRDNDPNTNPDGYLFWDDLHPTAEAHALLAARGLQSLLAPIPGDTTLDRLLTADDIDLLRSAIASEIDAARYDIDSNSVVNMGDVAALVEVELATQFGDVNLDRNVDAGDLTLILANYGAADATWSDGELTGDNLTGGRDFLRWQAAHGFAAGQAHTTAMIVPEPGRLILALAAVLGVGLSRRTISTSKTAL